MAYEEIVILESLLQNWRQQDAKCRRKERRDLNETIGKERSRLYSSCLAQVATLVLHKDTYLKEEAVQIMSTPPTGGSAPSPASPTTPPTSPTDQPPTTKKTADLAANIIEESTPQPKESATAPPSEEARQISTFFPTDQNNWINAFTTGLSKIDVPQEIAQTTEDQDAHDAYALSLVQHAVNEAAKSAGLPEIFESGNEATFQGHKVLFLEDRIIISSISPDEVNTFVTALKSSTAHVPALASHKALIDKLSTTPQHVKALDKTITSQAERIAKDAAGLLLENLLAEKATDPAAVLHSDAKTIANTFVVSAIAQKILSYPQSPPQQASAPIPPWTDQEALLKMQRDMNEKMRKFIRNQARIMAEALNPP